MRDAPAYSAEGNEGIRRLAAYVEAMRAGGVHLEGRVERGGRHTGTVIVKRTHHAGGRTTTVVQVRDARRAGGRQYRTVHSIDDLQLKGTNGRYAGAIGQVRVFEATAGRPAPPMIEPKVPTPHIPADVADRQLRSYEGSAIDEVAWPAEQSISFTAAELSELDDALGFATMARDETDVADVAAFRSAFGKVHRAYSRTELAS